MERKWLPTHRHQAIILNGAKVDGKNLSAERKPETATQAWNSICEATEQFDPLHQADELRKLVSFQARRAARAVGGMVAIAGRDRYTATKLRVAFVEAFEAGRRQQPEHAASTVLDR